MPASLAGSKRGVAGNVTSRAHMSILGFDGEHPAEHIDPRNLFCGTCATQSSCYSSGDPRPSKRRASTRKVAELLHQASKNSAPSHSSSATALDNCLPSCDECVFDNSCPEQCTLPCSGDKDCSAENACWDPNCDGTPCFEQCMDPQCTKLSCPDNQCFCQQCDAENCPLEDPWSSCHTLHPAQSWLGPAFCHMDPTHQPQYDYQIPYSPLSNQCTQTAFPSFPEFETSYNHFTSYTQHTHSSSGTLGQGLSSNDYTELSRLNEQPSATTGVSLPHSCSLGIPFDHCHIDPQSCCHGYVEKCDLCSGVPQFHPNTIRSSIHQSSGQSQTFEQENREHQSPFISTSSDNTAYNQPSASDSVITITNDLSACNQNMEGPATWPLGGSQFFVDSLTTSAMHSNSKPVFNTWSLPVSRSLNGSMDDLGTSYLTSVSKSASCSTRATSVPLPVALCEGQSRSSTLSPDQSVDEGINNRAINSMILAPIEASKTQFDKVPVCQWNMATSEARNPKPCSRQFDSAKALHHHIKTDHVNQLNGSYTCQWIGCESTDKDFKQRSKLSRHLLTHAEYRPFMCGFKGCDKTFGTNQAKDNHERTHEGKKPYECEFCDYVTTTATQLKTHTNAKHVKDKRFKCRMCDFACADSSNLSKHEKTHKARPYRCPHLDCSYKPDCRWENVKRHFKKSGHCPELLVDDSPEQLAYKKAAAEEARKDPLPRKSQSRVKNTHTFRSSEGEESL